GDVLPRKSGGPSPDANLLRRTLSRSSPRLQRRLQTERCRRSVLPVIVAVGTATNNALTDGRQFSLGLRPIHMIDPAFSAPHRPGDEVGRQGRMLQPPQRTPAPV